MKRKKEFIIAIIILLVLVIYSSIEPKVLPVSGSYKENESYKMENIPDYNGSEYVIVLI